MTFLKATEKLIVNYDSLLQDYPDADRAFVVVYGPQSESSEGITVELTGEQRDTLTVCAAPKSSDIYCEVMVPIKYGEFVS